MLRSAAMNSLLERNDTIVVASVASIYGLGNPEQYKEMIFSLRVGQEIDRKELLTYLVDRQYQRNDIEQSKGTFRVRGDVIEIVPDVYKRQRYDYSFSFHVIYIFGCFTNCLIFFTSNCL